MGKSLEDISVTGLQKIMWEKHLKEECEVADIWGDTAASGAIPVSAQVDPAWLEKMKKFVTTMEECGVTVDDLKDWFDLVDEESINNDY